MRGIVCEDNEHCLVSCVYSSTISKSRAYNRGYIGGCPLKSAPLSRARLPTMNARPIENALNARALAGTSDVIITIEANFSSPALINMRNNNTRFIKRFSNLLK